MDRQIRARDNRAPSLEDEAYAIVAKAQALYRTWVATSNERQRTELQRAYRRAVEDLHHVLEAQLWQLVRQWLTIHIGSLAAHSLEEQGWSYDIEPLVLSVFADIVERLPNVILSEEQDVLARLLIIAEQSLYNRG